jgi:hypothetical protein
MITKVQTNIQNLVDTLHHHTPHHTISDNIYGQNSYGLVDTEILSQTNTHKIDCMTLGIHHRRSLHNLDGALGLMKYTHHDDQATGNHRVCPACMGSILNNTFRLHKVYYQEDNPTHDCTNQKP